MRGILNELLYFPMKVEPIGKACVGEKDWLAQELYRVINEGQHLGGLLSWCMNLAT